MSRRHLVVAGRFAVGLLVPTALYYLLRAVGASVYVALVVSTLVSALPSLWALVHRRRANALSLYFTVMVLGSLVVAAVPGGTRFLLAREAILTAITGVWFAVSARADRPLAYAFSRPVLEGRWHWPDRWDELWARSPAFRRMWRVSSIMYGVGLLLDAAVRVLLAYTRPPDTVPALGLVVTVVTTVVLNVVVHGYYVLCRVHDSRSPMRQEGPPRHALGTVGPAQARVSGQRPPGPLRRPKPLP